jgi:hypothetical protein
MTLAEAQRKVWVFRLVGWVMTAVGTIAIILIFGKMAYLMLSGDPSFQILPGVRSVRVIDPQNNPLQHALKTYPILAFIWYLVPTGDYWFLMYMLISFMVWGFVGGMLVRYADSLSGRIRRTRHAVEEERWRRTLGEIPSDLGVLSIQLESEERWYTRPGGLLFLGIIVEVIAGLILLWLTSR